MSTSVLSSLPPLARVRIKICGIREPQMAQVAIAAGADAIGMVFHLPSARNVELAQAAAIVRACRGAPFVTTVAVLANPSAEVVRALVATVKPDCLQFHGEEAPEFCMAFDKPYIKAARIAPGTRAEELRALEVRYAGAQAILLDTHAEGGYGGSGTVFDWKQANYGGVKPVVLAGGLTQENVVEAMEAVKPYGVDVSSGVEVGGRKDAERIREFCRVVRGW